MAIKESITSINDLSQGRGSLDRIALKEVIRKKWESEFDQGKAPSKEVKEQLGVHASNMKGILNNYDYEIFCMPNIIANTKSMSKPEVKEYLKHMEALAVGYSSVFNSDLATLILIGITCKSRNVHSIARYYETLSFDISKRISRYEKMLQKNSDFASRINYEIKTAESGFFRFLRKKRVTRLRTRASARSIKIKKIQGKLSRYGEVKAKMSR